MRNIFIIFAFIVSAFLNLEAIDFNILFNKPIVESKYYFHILQKDRPQTVTSVDDFTSHSFLFGKNKSLFCYKRKRLFLDFKYKLGLSFAKNSNNHYHQYFYGARLTGNIGNKFLFFSDWWKVQFSRPVEKVQTPLQDSWNEEKSVDNSNTIIKYQGKIADLYLGRSKFQIGSGITGSVILSNVADEYGFFAFKFKMKNIEVSLLHSALIPDSLNADFVQNPADFWNKKYEDKYLALHKLDYRNNGLHLFVGEEVVYGSRSIDVNYILPLAFWRAVEHDLGDRDNMFMFCGLDWRFKEKNIVYFNFNLDDLTKSKIFTDFWGNKYAAQLGYQRKINDKILFTAELVAVRPWTYTHKKVVNVFSNNKKPLGYPYGSNLLGNNYEISYRILHNLTAVCKYSYIKQGSVGNNFDMNYLQVGNQTTAKAKWLDGDVNSINRFYFSVDYGFLGTNTIHSTIEYKKDEYEKNTRVSIQYQIQF